jgi:hypothetical protein
MTTNLKLILSAVGVAALLASPAMAKSRHHDAARSLANVPSDARAESYAPASSYAPATSTQRVYAPDLPVPAHHGDLNPDFQLGGDK